MEDPRARQVGDARLGVLSSGWIATVIVVGCSLTAICLLVVLQSSLRMPSGNGAQVLGNDFRVFWAAGKLALQGDYLTVFDTTALSAVHGVNPEEWMPWLYPPGLLLLLAPFGAVSYATAFATITVLSCLCITLAMRPFLANSKIALLSLSLAPAYLPILIGGQNGLIWLAGLLAALAALRDERWIVAGVFIGLLTLKPQFGLLIPIALLAAGLWQTTFVASLTAIVVAAVPTLLTGPDYWTLFFQRLAEFGHRVLVSIRSLDLMASPFAFFIRLGVPAELAITLQVLVTFAAGLAVLLVWHSRHLSFDVKAAVLLSGSLLASPYGWHYEAAIMAPLGLFLLRAGIVQPNPLQFVLLLLLWLGTGLQAVVLVIGLQDVFFPWALFVTPMLLLCLFLCVAQLWRTRHLPLGAT